MEKHNYNVEVTWKEGRRGVICSPELKNAGIHNCIEVATPPEFPKGIPYIWSPEHLFTASIASCFMTTFLAIAENSQLPFLHFTCASEGVLEEVGGKPELTEIILKPVVTIADEKFLEKALRVLQKSESACLVSHAVRIRIATLPSVMVN